MDGLLVGLLVVVRLVVVLGGGLLVVRLGGLVGGGGFLPPDVESGGLLMAVKMEISSSDRSPKSGMSFSPILFSCPLGSSEN